MSFAPPYTQQTSFSDDEANQAAGRSIVRTANLDTEFANLASTVGALNNNIQKIQRDDDKLIDFLVEPYALSEQTRALLATGGLPRGVWSQSTQYAIRDVVQYNTSAFICYTAHLSGATFNQNGFWIAISGDGAAAAAAIEAANSAAAAAASEATAIASAATATASADSAAADAATVASAVSSAQNSATSSAASAGSAASSASQAAASAVVASNNAVLRDYLAGFTVTSTTTTLVFQPGQAADSTNTDYITQTGAITKTNASWAAGNGNGGWADAGAIPNNTRLYSYAVLNQITGVSDFALSASDTAPPTGGGTFLGAAGFTKHTKLPVYLITDGSGLFKEAYNIAPASTQIQPITASVNGSGGAPANGMLITLNPTALDFRSATLGSGTVNTRVVASPISLTISSGSTLGTTNGVRSRLMVIAIDNAGTVELAAVNLAGGNDLSETGLITTSAEGGAGGADTANFIYSNTARTSVPYRVVGYVESTQATAGTWATAPSTIQGAGGQAVAAMSSLGFGQTWQNVTRTSGTTYYNTTGKPILLSARFVLGATPSQITVNSVLVCLGNIDGNSNATLLPRL